MPRCVLDHLVVTAFSLEAGATYVRDILGVDPQPGGEHPRMATHNRLLRLGDAMYLEVIAPNPLAPPPSRPRWFGLDRLRHDSPPALGAWVVRSTDIQAATSVASEALGAVETMNRGALDWLITIPADGSLPLGGAAPALIEWRVPTHPASQLEDHGLSLIELEIAHPEPGRVARLLAALELDAPVSVSAAPVGVAARLIARIDTPQGQRVLGG